MNFYPHHIKDFNNSTRHLTRVERSVYRDAIELYYDSEFSLTHDILSLSRKLLCRTDEEKDALSSILSEFFLKTDDGFFHERCDAEISKYRANTSAKARAGIASAKARKEKAQQKSTGVEQVLTVCSTNQEPVTSNQEPITNIKTLTPTAILSAMNVEPEISKEWLKVRKTKRLAATETAFKAVEREAIKAGLTMNQAITRAVEESWGGFKAEWLEGKDNGRSQQKQGVSKQPDNAATRGLDRNKKAYAAAVARELDDQAVHEVSSNIRSQMVISN